MGPFRRFELGDSMRGLRGNSVLALAAALAIGSGGAACSSEDAGVETAPPAGEYELPIDESQEAWADEEEEDAR